jgi:hypothetical protein
VGAVTAAPTDLVVPPAAAPRAPAKVNWNVSDNLISLRVCHILFESISQNRQTSAREGTIMARAKHVSLVLLGTVALSVTAASPASAICKKEKGYYDGISGNFCSGALSKENGEYNEPSFCGGAPVPPPASRIALETLLSDRTRTGDADFLLAGFSWLPFSVT